MRWFLFHTRLSAVVLAAAAIVCCPAVSQAADILSFNISRGWEYPINGVTVSPQSNGMDPAELAGAPGVNVANWNNIFVDWRNDNLMDNVPDGLSNNETPGPYAGDWTTAYGDPLDDSGSHVAGVHISWYDRGGIGGRGNGTDDARMFSSDWDTWGRNGDTDGSPTLLPDGAFQIDGQVVVTGIPYATYDVYAYVGGAGEPFGDRGGTFYANGVPKGLSMLSVADGTYVEVPTDGVYELQGGGNTVGVTSPWDGTFVHFTGLSGDLTLSVDATTDGGQRMRWAGFQIVGQETLVPSDLNSNGFVDFEDLTILLANWNKDVGAADGNLVEPLVTVVNFADLTVLLAAWTGPGPAGAPEAALGAEAVPEPSTLILGMIATLGLSFYRRRKPR
ncbi:MAG: PEP-CTERM sorting domain-containing protein [Planctomycetes bacterium]|nr:PEP-CTERM sorting domain-containing protein [Planctomycetota bacterium]